MIRKIPIQCTLLIVLLLLAAPVMAQDPAEDDLFGDGVIELEEIRIEVEAELPTVVITLVRQEPTIPEEKLQPPLKKMVQGVVSPVKPKISDVEITPIEKPGKILAKDR